MHKHPTLTTLIGAVFALPAVLPAQAQSFDVTSLNGDYSYSISGSAADPNTGGDDFIAESGRLTADGAGNVTGIDTVLINGALVRRTFGGTYSINPDGTGALVVNPSWGPQIHADLVVGNGGRAIKLVVTDSGNTLSGSIESQQSAGQSAPQQGYDASALDGGYEYKIEGTAADQFGFVFPVREVGLLSLDGAGNVTGTSTVSVQGSVVRRTLTGTYGINPDGSGWLTLYPSWGPTIDADVFLASSGLKADFVVTDSGNTLSGALAAQAPPQAN